jgi:hypothetical protein
LTAVRRTGGRPWLPSDPPAPGPASSDRRARLPRNPVIHNEVETLFDGGLAGYPGEIEHDVYESDPLFGHGRIDSYKRAAVGVTSGMADKYPAQFSGREGLKTVVRVTRTSTVKKTGATTTTDRHHITSIDPDQEKILALRLNHWKVETTHFFLTHTFEEDKRGVTKKGGAEVLSVLRKPSPNILKTARIEARESFSFTVKKIQADSHYLAEIDSVIGNIFGDA